MINQPGKQCGYILVKKKSFALIYKSVQEKARQRNDTWLLRKEKKKRVSLF